MQTQRTRFGLAVRLEQGEEVVAALKELAARESLRAGTITAIGAVGDPELGYFARRTRVYERRTFPGEWEITSLMGNFSELEGAPFPHLHVVLGGPDFSAVAGHLFRGVVTVTCEAMIATDPGVLHRVARPELGFNPLELG